MSNDETYTEKDREENPEQSLGDETPGEGHSAEEPALEEEKKTDSLDEERVSIETSIVSSEAEQSSAPSETEAGEEDKGPQEDQPQTEKAGEERQDDKSESVTSPEDKEAPPPPRDDENSEAAAPEDETEKQGQEQKPGEPPGPVRLVGVKFRRAGKTYFFNAGNLLFNIGGQVIVETDRGLGLARVVTPLLEKEPKDAPKDLKRVIRKANWNDIERDRKNKQREKEARRYCNEKIRSRNLDMKLVSVDYLHDASKAIFYFTAEQRVDFRELVKDLARHLHTRIEMRQIGVRDESKMVGGIGPCGREVCCATFLADFSPVSVRMAKDQNLAMNPAKVSGLCGRLMCCLAYEHELYAEMVKQMPKKGKLMNCVHGPCKVIDLNILARQVLVEVEGGKTYFLPVDQVVRPGEEVPVPEEDEDAMLDDAILDSDDPMALERASSPRERKPERGKQGRPDRGRDSRDRGKPQDRKKAESKGRPPDKRKPRKGKPQQKEGPQPPKGTMPVPAGAKRPGQPDQKNRKEAGPRQDSGQQENKPSGKSRRRRRRKKKK